jgi:hypothetical protein
MLVNMFVFNVNIFVSNKLDLKLTSSFIIQSQSYQFTLKMFV